MASQLANIASYKHPKPRKIMQEASSYKEKGSNLSLSKHSRLSNYDYQLLDQNNDSSESEERFANVSAKGEKPEDQDHKALQGLSRGQKARFLRRLGLWFVAYSVLKKAKSLHEKFCSDAKSKNLRIGAAEASSVDAYFSLPVVYASDSASYV